MLPHLQTTTPVPQTCKNKTKTNENDDDGGDDDDDDDGDDLICCSIQAETSD